MQSPGSKRVTARTLIVFILTSLLALTLAWVPAPAAQAAPVYNVRDFGAAGDGVRDDSASIQAAINAIDSTVGGTVYVPDGVYRVRYGAYTSDITLQLKSNMTFQMAAARNGR